MLFAHLKRILGLGRVVSDKTKMSLIA
jgi:hypothetical protein